MRAIAGSIVTELESSKFRIFHLLDIEISGTHYYFTDCDVAITFLGVVYSPRPFSVETVDYSTGRVVDKMSLQLDNLDDMFTTVFVGGTPRGGTVVYSAVLLDEDYNVITGAVITSFWEPEALTGGIKPIADSDSILGLWEEDEGTGGIKPITGAGTEDYWEIEVSTGGIKPK